LGIFETVSEQEELECTKHYPTQKTYLFMPWKNGFEVYTTQGGGGP